MTGDTLPFPGGDFPRPFGVPQQSVGFYCAGCGMPNVAHAMGHCPPASAVAGPESVAEHLRNALQLLNALRLPPSADWYDDVHAVRRRVAAALAQLEGK